MNKVKTFLKKSVAYIVAATIICLIIGFVLGILKIALYGLGI